MKIEASGRGKYGILSFRAETQAEQLQLEWLRSKAKEINLQAFTFVGLDDDGGGISFVIKSDKDEK